MAEFQFPPGWPKASIAETYKILTAPGAPFEMEEAVVRGNSFRVYKNARPHLRALYDEGVNFAEREFIAYEGESITYGEHWRAANALGRVLLERYGIRKGDRIVNAMRNLPEWSIVFWASVAIGAVAVPLNAWGLGPDLAYGIKDSGATVAILDAERLDRLRPHIGELGGVKLIVVRPTAGQDDIPSLESLIGKQSDYAKLPGEPLPDPKLATDDNATIFYTSGTTGQAKGVLGTHRNIMTNLVTLGFSGARAFVRRGEPVPAPDPNAPQQVMLLPVPFFHVTGCHSVLVPTYAAGNKLVLMHKWNADRACELIEEHKVNATTGVPTMIWQLLDSPEFERRDHSSVTAITYGGAAAAPELAQRVMRLFPGTLPGQGYGATETSSVSTSNGAEDYQAKPQSVGIPVPIADLRVTNADDQVLPQGEVGELWIHGCHVAVEYWNKPEQTARAFQNGWYRTGDVVRIDEEGFVYLLDRARDMLIRGGENIYCVEIEDALMAHPDVIDAAVVGLPHKILGEEVAAIVRLKRGAKTDDASIKAHVGRLLPAYKVPVLVEFRDDELPRNASGKILKTQLRQELKKD
ncbi:MAG: acyl--CoA ligase [Alphaproteobacteria bacterium]|nr:acyl--CoA ligase [Alphaproteobacteria bacterium]